MVEGNFARVGSGSGRHRSADFTRIRSIQRVADVAGRSRDGQPKSTDHIAAVLGEGGCHRGGIQVSRLQLRQDRGGPLGHVIGHDVVDPRQPVLIPVQRGGHLRITPAGRLRHHSGVNLVGPHRKAGSGGRRGQGSIIEEMFLDVVGHSKAELRISTELLPQILRVALSNTPTRGRSIRSGPILGTIQQGMLGIMGRKPEPAMTPGPIPLSIPVVGRRVPKEVRNRRIEITAVKNYQHVVDEVVDIEQVFVSGVLGSVGIATLEFKIGRIIYDARFGGVVETGPGSHVPVRGVDGVRPGLDLDDVVVVFVAAVVGGRIGRFGALTTIVEAPVLAIDVQVVVVPALPLSPHVELAIPAELIANENPLGIPLKTPRVVLKGTKVEGVKFISARIAEERKL